MEQSTFEPNDMVPGTGLSPDKMLLARGSAYADAHRARLGVNDKHIPVNQPTSAVHSYSKDGSMRVVDASDPMYAPDSHGGLAADPSRVRDDDTWQVDGAMVRTACTLRPEDDDWGQAGTLVGDVVDDAERERLVSDVAGHLGNGVSEPILQGAFEYWQNIDPDIGERIEPAVRAKA